MVEGNGPSDRTLIVRRQGSSVLLGRAGRCSGRCTGGFAGRHNRNIRAIRKVGVVMVEIVLLRWCRRGRIDQFRCVPLAVAIRTRG